MLGRREMPTVLSPWITSDRTRKSDISHLNIVCCGTLYVILVYWFLKASVQQSKSIAVSFCLLTCPLSILKLSYGDKIMNLQGNF